MSGPDDQQLDVEVETGTGALRLDLTRRLVAEGLGTGFLIIAVIGSGTMASFANPAVTLARTSSDSFAGINPSSAAMFIVMQLIGALIALALIHFLSPRRGDR